MIKFKHIDQYYKDRIIDWVNIGKYFREYYPDDDTPTRELRLILKSIGFSIRKLTDDDNLPYLKLPFLGTFAPILDGLYYKYKKLRENAKTIEDVYKTDKIINVIARQYLLGEAMINRRIEYWLNKDKKFKEDFEYQLDLIKGNDDI